MIPTMMTLSILMTNKCLQAIQMQNHHNINSLFAHILISVATLPSYHHVITLPYRHGPKNNLRDKKILKTSLCDMVVPMEYNRVFYEVKPLKISNLHTSMHI